MEGKEVCFRLGSNPISSNLSEAKEGCGEIAHQTVFFVFVFFPPDAN